MALIQSLTSRSRGILLGAAVGDALGWPQEQNSNIIGGNYNRHIDATQEFRSWARYCGGRYRTYIDPVSEGSYSDDTQLILATGRSLQSKDWFTALTHRELPLLLLYSRGAGGATLRACQTWAMGIEPWLSDRRKKAYFQAGGNGVAMRIAPHVIMHVARPPEELVSRVVQDGVATHGHPRALVGAAAYAVALHALINTDSTLEFGELPARVKADKSWQSPEALLTNVPSTWKNAAFEQNPNFMSDWIDATNEMVKLISQVENFVQNGTRGDDLGTLRRFGVFDKTRNGAGTITASAAIYLASRNAPRPMSGLLRSAFAENADTDTLASMTGALLGALHGPDWLAELHNQVQDSKYIKWMADDLAARSLGSNDSIANTINFVDKNSIQHFKEQLKVGHGEGSVRLPDMRQGHLLSDFKLQSRRDVYAHRWIVDVGGQTLIIDKTESLVNSGAKDRAYLNTSRRMPSTQLTEKDSGDGKFISLTLPVNDLNLIAGFYSEILGIPVHRIGSRELIVDRTVKFQEISGATYGMSKLALEFEVSDIVAVARRVGHGPLMSSNSFNWTDPAGHTLHIRSTRR